MSDERIHTGGAHCGTALAARKPRAVVVGGSPFAGEAAAQFRAMGWDAFTVAPGDDLACAVLARKPNAVLLPVDSGTESGFLVAAKLRKAKPKLRIVLIGAARNSEAERFAKFVGAAFVTETDGIDLAVGAVSGN